MLRTQYSAGVPYPILSNISQSQDLSYVKGRTILATTRKQHEEYNGKIHLAITYVKHSLLKNGVSIMYLVNTQNNHTVNLNQKAKSMVFECF